MDTSALNYIDNQGNLVASEVQRLDESTSAINNKF